MYLNKQTYSETIKSKTYNTMKRTKLIVFALLLLIFGCKNEKPIIKETWIEKPLSQWPSFSLTNEISFKDTTYTDLANSFLVNTGQDTLGISCKHLFMVFENQLGLKTIDLEKNFNYWKLYPKNDNKKSVSIARLINENPKEIIGQFNTLKVRDWILFEINKNYSDLYPLKIRYTPVKTNEIVYAVGWGMKQKDNTKPALIKLQCFKNMGNYFYTQTLTKNIQPNGRSGSPVIDKNGYLVGIVSGAEGNLGVIGSVNYLIKMFDKYKIEYEKPSR
jgi:hypothetical protein